MQDRLRGTCTRLEAGLPDAGSSVAFQSGSGREQQAGRDDGDGKVPPSLDAHVIL